MDSISNGPAGLVVEARGVVGETTMSIDAPPPPTFLEKSEDKSSNQETRLECDGADHETRRSPESSQRHGQPMSAHQGLPMARWLDPNARREPWSSFWCPGNFADNAGRIDTEFQKIPRPARKSDSTHATVGGRNDDNTTTEMVLVDQGHCKLEPASLSFKMLMN